MLALHSYTNYDQTQMMLCTDSEEMVCMLTVQIWKCGKRVPVLGTLDSDGPTHLEPLTEG